ncbi:Glucan endo-1,3-beta-glucosidase [Thalictrum thalictroides]|uniref:Glucan endo-1,3-beta-glucosidase n=1 Tax=Thalictrum thalictroides TaxID=46969 RepID=A0A7J6WFU0_THATH|nr:Glucan endo-1,3-beta-glucosidase [Thalictrum thalictroides]
MARGGYFFLLITIGLLASYVVDGLGVNWGQITTHILPPKVVVQMLKDNKISKVKLFEIDDATMQGLAGSNIEVMVAVPNYLLNSMTNPKTASQWVEKNVTKYLNQKPPVNIKYVAVGNEPFLAAYNGSFLNSTYPALKNVQTALNDAGHGDKVKATVPLNADIFMSPSNHYVPSAGYFRPDISTQMSDIAKFLDKNKAPFTINIYPFFNIYQNPGFPFDYAFFDGIKYPLMDDDIAYENSFDGAYDTLIMALEKVGVKNIPIIIGEVGWPTDGDKNANVELAEKFYRGLMKKIGNNMGTPLRPKQYIEVYLFGLLDEDAKDVSPGNFERHWGLFTQDGQPKFPIDLTGKGRNITLVGAKDVKMLPKKWCILRSDAKNETLIEETIKYACNYGDCTPLGMGCSCGNLDAAGNASFAYNVYYQTMGQKAGSCGFSGLAMETTKNPSSGNCTFAIRLAPPPTPSPPPASAPESGPPADGKAQSSKSSAYYYGPSLLLLLGLEVVASFFF